ncbi:hypothetical protein L484_005085 [Morus notabilis]|uniref:Uncharacterized protein n=1 Tax=Morus notabilis TaxID=981085 RepID=W9QNE5_9ROSA|nr:hypothetical protein L484_005085 [Morus notabilis]
MNSGANSVNSGALGIHSSNKDLQPSEHELYIDSANRRNLQRSCCNDRGRSDHYRRRRVAVAKKTKEARADMFDI